MQKNKAMDAHLAEQLAELLAEPELTAVTVNDPESVWQEHSGRRQRLEGSQIDPDFILALLAWAKSLDFGECLISNSRVLRLDLFSPWHLNILRLGEKGESSYKLNFVRDEAPQSYDELNSRGLLPDLAKTFLQACVQARRSILFISPQLKTAQSLLHALAELKTPVLDSTAYVLDLDIYSQIGLSSGILPLSSVDDYFAIAAQMGRDKIYLDGLQADTAPSFLSQAPAWPGSCACMRAAYADSALLQLVAWLNMAGFIDASANKMIMASFELIVEIGRDADGLQRVQRILEIDRQADWPGLREIFVSRLADDDEAAVPVFVPAGLRPHFLPAFAPFGVNVPAGFFDPQSHGFAPQANFDQRHKAAPIVSSLVSGFDEANSEQTGPPLDQVANLNPPAFPLAGKRDNFTPSRTDEFFDVGHSEDVLEKAIQQAETRSQIAPDRQGAQEKLPAEVPLDPSHALADPEMISDDPGWEVEVLHRQAGALPAGGPPEELPMLPEHLQHGLSPELRQSLGELIPDLAEQDAEKKPASEPSPSSVGQHSAATANYQPQPPAMHPQALHLQSQLEAPTHPNRSDEELPSQKHLDVQDSGNSDKPLKGL